MKLNLKFIFLIIFTAFLSGCAGTSKQFVEKPDLNVSLNENESIIKLKRVKHFAGGAREPDVIANDVLIGEIANGDELIWKTESNSFECIAIDYGMDMFLSTGIILDSTPLSYKCFQTKPREVLSLTYDWGYPKMRAVRECAFVPIFKDIDKPKSSIPIAIGSITSKVEEDTETDIKGLLLASMQKQFKEKLTDSSTITIDIEMLDYKTGNAALRWLASSETASTFAKVKVTVKENNEIIDAYITRPVISFGGFYTVGADDYIFDEIAEDIYLYFFEP
ncbi:MAG: hypothetical protein M0O99_05490 [Desulfuromonas thiophila]|jgi:hypothetical protein|nr:hypothetical protein [Desulfuromonas thiophila]